MSAEASPPMEMTPDRWARVTAVLGAALEMPPMARGSFVADACGSDTDLRREVDDLLAAALESGDHAAFLDRPVVNLHAPAARAGDQIGRYRIRRLIGRGGMGEVYLADDVRLSRAVALKLLRGSGTGDVERLGRLVREARAASLLSHPNICVVHDVGDSPSGLPYIAMEYVEGESLRSRLVRARETGALLNLPEVLDHVAQAATGLAAAHTVGVLHRDIKPENLLLRPDQLLKVVDFGLAARMSFASTGPESSVDEARRSSGYASVSTPRGLVVGTVPYMSPEQLRGLPLDARTDVWSLGAVLYELLTGVPAFSGASQSDLVASVLDCEPLSLAARVPALPTALVALVESMLSKTRDQRPVDMNAVATTLRALHADLLIHAEAPSTGRWSTFGITGRHVAAAVGGGLAVTAMLMMGAATRANDASQTTDARRALPLDRNRVLITAFKNGTGIDSLDALGQLAADWVALGLQAVPSLRVVDPGTALLSERSEAAARSASDTTRRDEATTPDPLGAAQTTGAGLVASGRFDAIGDSLVFVARVSDVASGEQQSMLRISAPRSASALLLTKLRQQVGGAVARAADERVATLSDAATPPPSLDAYRAYVEGLLLFSQSQYAQALPFFQQAIELDSTFMLPRFWAMFAYGNAGRRPERDALLEATRRYASGMSLLDAASLEYFEAERRSDHDRKLRAVRRASGFAPGSNWTYIEGVLERRAGRPRVALARFDEINPARGWARGWAAYWTERTAALHELGLVGEQLADVQLARRINSDDPVLRRHEVSALASAGQIGALRVRLDSLRRNPGDDPRLAHPALAAYLDAGIELRAHGYLSDGADFLKVLVDWQVSADGTAAQHKAAAWHRAKALMELGRTGEAEAAFRSLTSKDPEDLDAHTNLAILLAGAGRRQAALAELAIADRIAARDPRHEVSRLFVRGVVFCLLGERAAGTEVIATALARGYHGRLLLHRYLHLRSAMRGYAPFEALLNPQP